MDIPGQNEVPLGNQSTGLNPTAGAILTGASGALGGIVSGIFNKRAQDKAWERNLEQWHRANEYNHPAKQVERMKAAGLNPAMMYKGAPQNVATGSPKMTAPNYDFGIGDVSQYQQIRTMKANEALMKANAKTALTTEMLKGLQASGQKETNRGKRLSNDLLETYGGILKELEVEGKSASIGVTKAEEALKKQMLTNAKTDNEKKQVDTNIAKLEEFFTKYGLGGSGELATIGKIMMVAWLEANKGLDWATKPIEDAVMSKAFQDGFKKEFLRGFPLLDLLMR